MARMEGPDKTSFLAGGVRDIPEKELMSPEMYRKIMGYLKVINFDRPSPFRFVQLLSGNTQVVNGVIENYTLSLRESGRVKTALYRLKVYRRGGMEYFVNISLTPLGNKKEIVQEMESIATE